MNEEEFKGGGMEGGDLMMSGGMGREGGMRVREWGWVGCGGLEKGVEIGGGEVKVMKDGKEWVKVLE